MAKTRKPKTKKPKSEPKAEKKSRNVKKDTSEIIENALLAFSAARVKVELVESVALDELNSAGYADLLKRIRDGQSALRAARATITVMRNTPWRENMLKHLTAWDKALDEAWDGIIAGLDSDE